MAGFYSVVLTKKESRDELATAISLAEQTVGEKLANPEYKIGSIKLHEPMSAYSESYMSVENANGQENIFFVELSEILDDYVAVLSSSDGEDTSFVLYNKGEVVMRYTNFPESNYHTDIFKGKENILDFDKAAEILGVANVESFKKAFDRPQNIGFQELALELGLNFAEYEPF